MSTRNLSSKERETSSLLVCALSKPILWRQHLEDNGTDDGITGRTGQEGDIASAILYLGSRAGAYVNGEVIHVDGGMYSLSGMLECGS